MTRKRTDALRIRARNKVVGKGRAEQVGKIPDQKMARDDAVEDSSQTTAGLMAELRVQEQAQRESDIATGRLILGAEIQTRLGIDRRTLEAALREQRIFAITGASGELYYPAFFADRRQYDLATLERICKALADLPGSVKWYFFLQPRISLGGRSPLEALLLGMEAVVIDAAHAFAEI